MCILHKSYIEASRKFFKQNTSFNNKRKLSATKRKEKVEFELDITYQNDSKKHFLQTIEKRENLAKRTKFFTK